MYHRKFAHQNRVRVDSQGSIGHRCTSTVEAGPSVSGSSTDQKSSPTCIRQRMSFTLVRLDRGTGCGSNTLLLSMTSVSSRKYFPKQHYRILTPSTRAVKNMCSFGILGRLLIGRKVYVEGIWWGPVGGGYHIPATSRLEELRQLRAQLCANR